MPVVAFSVGEEELRGVDTKPLVGHLAAWNYFMSLKNPVNDAWKKEWAAYAKAKKLPGADKPLTNDPMEATYVGIHMWKQAVEKAKSFDTDKVIAAMAGQSFKAPDGFTIKMDEKNHHLHKPVFIGEVKADGQFNVVWKTTRPDPRATVEPVHRRQRQEEGRARGSGTREEIRGTKSPMWTRRRQGAAAARRESTMVRFILIALMLLLGAPGAAWALDAATSRSSPTATATTRPPRSPRSRPRAIRARSMC